MPDLRCAVIVGDICSTHDADKLSETGALVVQIDTDQFAAEGLDDWVAWLAQEA